MQHIARPTVGSTLLTLSHSLAGGILCAACGYSRALVGAFGNSRKSTSVLLTPVFGFLSTAGCMACSVPCPPEFLRF
ncbi:hypothetical protein B9Z19DRAFT_1084798 [Tuber borchii]|uniref:Uncharacterized protein n=1 Tax=Tuber borchii TaxID=42251 RepID=A0A2T6ZRL1_TUBBO|nr:hypothetical protein B9Z19DRAFT_1084798 [Tuber borchii]